MTKEELLEVISEYGGAFGGLLILISLFCILGNVITAAEAKGFIIIGFALVCVEVLFIIRKVITPNQPTE